MKKYIKPEMETLVLSAEALMDIGLYNSGTPAAKDNNTDVWEEEVEE